MIRNAPLKNYYDEVLRLVPDGSASGQIATIDDGAANCPLKSLVVDIEPIQSGSGTPSPSNVRAISARSEVVVTRAGKNLLPFFTEAKTSGGITVTPTSDGRYNVAGTATSNTVIKYSLSSLTLSGTYKFVADNYTVAGLDNITIYYTPIGGGSTSVLYPGNTINLSEYVMSDIVFFVASGVTTNRQNVGLMLIPTSVSDESFEPYVGQTYTISLGQSIYGGTLDVGKGELVIDRAEVVPVVDTLQSINAHGIANFSFPISQRASNVWADKERAISNILPTQMSLIADTTEAGFTITNATVGYVRLESTDADTVEEANAWIQTNGLKIVYVVESPTTVSLSPTEIRTLYGINNLWSDSGSVEVTYKANATLLYNKIRNAIIAQGGQI